MEIAARGEEPFSVLRRKRALPTCDAVDVKKLASFAVGKKSSGPAVLHQRFQSELIAVRRLLKKAIPRSSAPGGGKDGGQRFLAAEPPAKKRKASPAPVIQLQRAEPAKKRKASPAPVIQRAEPAKKKKASPPSVIQEEEEDVDILGGVSPLVIPAAPAQLADEEEEVFVDICGDASPMPKNQDSSSSPASSSDSSDSDSDSSSSSSGSDSDSSDSDGSSGSDSDSDSSSSDSDGDSNESVSSPCPAPAERAAMPPITELIARAKGSLQRQRREKARQEVLETERTARPSDSIDPIDLELLGIAQPKDQYMVGPHSFLRRLGLFLKDDDDDDSANDHQQQQTSFFQEEDLEEGECRL